MIAPRITSLVAAVALAVPFTIIASGCDEDTVVEVPDEQCGWSSSRELHAWGLTFRAQTEVIGEAPTTIQTIVTATNTWDSEVTLNKPWAGCDVMLRVYLDRHRDNLVWTESGYFGATNRACLAIADTVTLPPGETRQFGETTLTASQILGDSLLPGCYYFEAVTWADDMAFDLGAGSAVLSR
jgi:hypothetical protein